MPIKYNLTKYDLLFSKIKKISTKRDTKELTKDERVTMFQAVLVASFSSSHSWQTYKILTAGASGMFHVPEVKKEFEDASSFHWKRVSPFDINEVANANIQGNSFSEWLFFNVPPESRVEISGAWKRLQKEFSKDCDTTEKVAYNR